MKSDESEKVAISPDAPAVTGGLPPVNVYDITAWLLAGAGIIIILKMHLLAALLGGLLVYELVHILAPFLKIGRISHGTSRLAAVGLLTGVVIAAVAISVIAIAAFFRSDPGSIPALLRKMAEIIENTRGVLPGWIIPYLPADADSLRTELVSWLQLHAGELQSAGREFGRTVAHSLIGMVIGAMVSLHEAHPSEKTGPLTAALTGRASRFSNAFRRVVFAQVRISAFNTFLTALFLAVLFPLFDVHLPLVKTMIAVTFITGLMPVIGNLVSNAIVFIVSLSHAPITGIAALAFLVLIHKLEYFLNARIVGGSIHASAWELLIAMLIMETVFGIPGVIAAPICYAYLKDELRSREAI